MGSRVCNSSHLLQLDSNTIENVGLISCICFLDDHLYVGHSTGLITRYAVAEVCDASGQRAHASKFKASGTMAAKKFVAKLDAVFGLNRIIVLCDNTAYLMDAVTLECVASSNAKLRNVADVAVNDRIRTLQPFVPMQVACAHLKKPNISIYSITDNAFELQQDLTVLPSPAVTLKFSYPNICLASRDHHYYLVRCSEMVNNSEQQVIPLFPVASSATTGGGANTIEPKPAIAAIWDKLSDETEFLLAGPGGLGMFIAASSGNAHRPPINWAELDIQHLHYLTPYIFAATKTEIWIYSLHDQQPKQMMPYSSNATAAIGFCNAAVTIAATARRSTNTMQQHAASTTSASSIQQHRQRPLIASNRDVIALVPTPWQEQVSSLIREERVLEALEVAQTYAGEDHHHQLRSTTTTASSPGNDNFSSSPTPFESSTEADTFAESNDSSMFNASLYMRKLKRVCAFMLASQQEFERAYAMLNEADVHPMDVIQMFTPDAVPAECRKFVVEKFSIASTLSLNVKSESQLSSDAGFVGSGSIGSDSAANSSDTTQSTATTNLSDETYLFDQALRKAKSLATAPNSNVGEKIADFVANYALARRDQLFSHFTEADRNSPSTKKLCTAYDTAVVNILAMLSNSQAVFDAQQFYYYLQQQQNSMKKQQSKSYQPTTTSRTSTPPPPADIMNTTEAVAQRYRRRCRQQVVNFSDDRQWQVSYSCCEALKHYNSYHAAALLHMRYHDVLAALRTWRACAEHKVEDFSFPGLEQTAAKVLSDAQLFEITSSNQSSLQIFFEQLEWVMRIDAEIGLTILRERQADVAERDVINFLARFPHAQMRMLEECVMGLRREKPQQLMVWAPRTQDEHLHTLLAVKYIQQCSQEPTADNDVLRQRLGFILKNSRALQPALVIDKLKLAGKTLQRELILLYAKMGEHDHALDILVNELHDYDAAVAYCVEQSSSSSSLYDSDSFIAEIRADDSSTPAATAQRRAKRRGLFQLLLSRYVSAARTDGEVNAESVDPADDAKRQFLRLLNDANAEFNALAVLKNDSADDVNALNLPDSLPLARLQGFLLHSLRQSLHTARMAQMQECLERALLMRLQNTVTEKQRHHMFTVTEATNRCFVCCHPVAIGGGGGGFMWLPTDKIVHVECCRRT